MDSFGCPNPNENDAERIVLAHGEGGRLARQLIRERIVARLASVLLPAAPLSDAAVLDRVSGRVVLTTDSYVITPRFFPGGDIGTLAVCGTINDLVVSGARPLWLSLSLMIEEGFALSELDRVLASVAATAQRTGVLIVTGDTKVVPRGAVDGLFINTTGVGELIEPAPPGPEQLQLGDVLLVSGQIGQHGVAVLAAREPLGFTPPPQSDCQPLIAAVAALREAGVIPRAMRDATRGGVAAVLQEWAESCGHSLLVDETAVPVSREVRGVCELLGLDPLYMANEGTMLVAAQAEDAERALAVLRTVPSGDAAQIIGRVVTRDVVAVMIRRALGRLQPLDAPYGAPQPRIC